MACSARQAAADQEVEVGVVEPRLAHRNDFGVAGEQLARQPVDTRAEQAHRLAVAVVNGTLVFVDTDSLQEHGRASFLGKHPELKIQIESRNLPRQPG